MALAVVVSFNCHRDTASPVLVLNSQSQNPSLNFSDSLCFRHSQKLTPRVPKTPSLHRRLMVVNGYDEGSSPDSDKPQDKEEVDSLGVKAALSVLKFYKREISPLLQKSCRYVPTCSEYSMEAYKKYGVVKGTILTTWRICRCNPLGGSGFDPPRWFDEAALPEE